ncbi:MAG TPA: Na+/H+ antiporter NhaA [Caulobacteraceae bacterium]|nr:Na+/H+ antiporter NhaA [Caulobacteraceae bacterium]
MARRLTLSFLRTEAGAGLVLALVAAAAVLAANSPLASDYFGFIEAPFPVRLGGFSETRTVAQWAREALMPIVFLVAGMQVKFEVLRGEFAGLRRLGLPIAAALGGLLGPAVVAFVLVGGRWSAAGAWATASATDMPMALAILAAAAPRLPGALRVFLMAIALADNLAAVAIAAIAYGSVVHPAALAAAGMGVAALAVMGWWRRAPFLFYAAGFAVVWALVLHSGISTALAGVACGFTVPVGARRAGQDSVLTYFSGSLHPYVAFGVLPFFVFTAAGFAFAGHPPEGLLRRMPMAVGLALALGKPAGVLAASVIAGVTRIGRRPPGVAWIDLAGAALVSGVGFSPSLFVGALAFGDDPVLQGRVRLAVFAGSLVAAVAGAVVLGSAQARRSSLREE